MAKRKRKKRDKKSKGGGFSLKKGVIVSIIQVAFLAAAALILVSFSRQGSLLVKVNDALVSYFSWTTIFLPFILISFGMLVSKFRTPVGQPNVLVGAMLFFMSLATLTRAGTFGKSSFEGVSALVTPIGAAIVLLGTTVVGLVILFNTSIDQFLGAIASILTTLRNALLGEKSVGQKGMFSKRKEMKVLGGDKDQQTTKPDPKPTSSKPATPQVEQKPIANVPGEEKVWNYPSMDLFESGGGGKAERGDIKGNAQVIEQTLESFGITARVVEVNLGPAVTQYALEVALGTKLSKITALERDMALALAAPGGSIRIEAPIPGRSLVGIELPNRSPEFVTLRKMIASDQMQSSQSKLAVSLGLDISGAPVVGDVGKMPHILIAGQTGSGKSVCINSFLASLLFRASPSELKLILVDPKRVELTGYNSIPHLLTPVIVEPEKVISALRWLMSEMDRRYKLFAQAGVRNIGGYNEMSGFQALPYIVLVIDELADVMLFSPVEVEDSVTRLAQMSRATGIHMVLATQRPSVDVITGLIKANIPARIAFAVSSQVDSRVILDTQGAEKLLGKGDMLYLPPEQAKPTRIQGSFVSDKEINSLVSYLKSQGIEPQYTQEVVAMPKPGTTQIAGVDEDLDEKFKEAVEIVCQNDRASASLLQRRLSIGYARAARILDQLEAAGVVSPADGSKPRDVLIQSPADVFPSAEVAPEPVTVEG